MVNELILIGSLLLYFMGVVLFFRFFGKAGLLAWTIFATIAANIEVIILVHAFGIDQTLGNILFASTFLVSDIASEIYGKKEANKIVNVSVAVAFVFAITTQIWTWYQPASEDIAMAHIVPLFKNTPRVIISSLVVFAVVQKFDVWLYHCIWDSTNRRFGDSNRFLWLRNNASTLVSQLLNTVLFTFAAFLGIYSLKTIGFLIISSYVIYIITSLIDTFFIYIARKWYREGKIHE